MTDPMGDEGRRGGGGELRIELSFLEFPAELAIGFATMEAAAGTSGSFDRKAPDAHYGTGPIGITDGADSRLQLPDLQCVLCLDGLTFRARGLGQLHRLRSAGENGTGTWSMGGDCRPSLLNPRDLHFRFEQYASTALPDNRCGSFDLPAVARTRSHRHKAPR